MENDKSNVVGTLIRFDKTSKTGSELAERDVVHWLLEFMKQYKKESFSDGNSCGVRGYIINLKNNMSDDNEIRVSMDIEIDSTDREFALKKAGFIIAGILDEGIMSDDLIVRNIEIANKKAAA